MNISWRGAEAGSRAPEVGRTVVGGRTLAVGRFVAGSGGPEVSRVSNSRGPEVGAVEAARVLPFERI